MDNNLESIASKMKAAIRQRQGIDDVKDKSAHIFMPEKIERKVNVPENLVPKLEEGEFLVALDGISPEVIVCLRELSWPEQLYIDAQCHKNGEGQDLYYDELLERGLIANEAVVWLYDSESSRVLINGDKNISKKVTEQVIHSIIRSYKQATTVTAEEANALIYAAKSYFKNQAQNDIPIPPIVVMVDMIAQKVMSYNEKELMSMSASKMEKIKLILSVRSEVLGFTHDAPSNANNLDKSASRSMGKMNFIGGPGGR